MATKKASKGARKTSAGRSKDTTAPMREALGQAARLSAERLNSAEVCQRLDQLAEEILRRACSQKQFDQSVGNCNERGCDRAEEPKIVPCLRLRWGDGPQDRLETEDTEILCLTVCNPYSNVTLKDFTAHVLVFDAGGASVPALPDGTPSVIIKPSFHVCFGDIPPCDPQRPDRSCVSRELVLISRGAKVGGYQVRIVYCFEACFTVLGFDHVFKIELVAS